MSHVPYLAAFGGAARSICGVKFEKTSVRAGEESALFPPVLVRGIYLIDVFYFFLIIHFKCCSHVVPCHKNTRITLHSSNFSNSTLKAEFEPPCRLSCVKAFLLRLLPFIKSRRRAAGDE